MKNKSYRVSGKFYIDFEKVVSAKSEAAAIRKARDQIISRRKIKKSDFNRYEVQVWDINYYKQYI